MEIVMPEIDGQQISKVRTLKTHYDQDSIEVTVDKKQYRIQTDQLIVALSECVWTTEKKKVHTYLKFSHPWKETRDEWLKS